MTTRCLLIAATAGAVGCGSQEKDPRFEPIEKAVEADLLTSPATAASVAVWLDGEIIWVGGFGHTDPAGEGAAPGEATQFLIGSDTKKLTAFGVLQAIQAGRLTLDTTVAEVLPDLQMTRAPAFTSTTLRELLSHRGGIADGGELTTTTTDAALADYAYGEFSTYPALAPPGAFYNYSNPNFSIAGLVARKSEVDTGDFAPGFGSSVTGEGDFHPISLADTWETAFTRPAGLVWSTPSDQMRLAEFLVDGDPAILDPALMREISSEQVVMYPDLPGGYGFGLFTSAGLQLDTSYYDVEVWAHGGNTPSHTSAFYVLPGQRFAISILSNGNGDDFTRTVVAAIEAFVELPAPSTPPQRTFDATQLDGLTGTYVDPNTIGDIIVTRTGDALAITIPALDEAGVPYDHALQPISTHVWLARVDGELSDVSFITGANGEAYLRNRQIVAVRGAGVRATRGRPVRPLPSEVPALLNPAGRR
jgi:CubicO group peptidase (beta-lactamase class C family)